MGESIVFSRVGIGTSDIHMQKDVLGCFPHAIQNMYSKRVIDLKARAKTIRLPVEKMKKKYLKPQIMQGLLKCEAKSLRKNKLICWILSK